MLWQFFTKHTPKNLLKQSCTALYMYMVSRTASYTTQGVAKFSFQLQLANKRVLT